MTKPKPKLVFFRWDHRPNERFARYILLHIDDQLRCLRQFFDVVLIQEDCDYSEVCARHQPDLALFEIGWQLNISRRIEIRNTSAFPEIPRAALLNADPWSPTRSGFLSDLADWGIGTAFSISTAVHDYLPQSLDQVFIWPNFIDPALFRDYGAEKTIPIMLSGGRGEMYPWRRRVFPLLAASYPCLEPPHLGYAAANASKMLWGEPYARTLNASQFSPTCGTVANDIVRKHLEIPGARCCLITQKSHSVEEAGFVHMINCVFADADDVLEVVDALSKDPERLKSITDAGYALVHSRHTTAQRSQIHQWFVLQKDLAPHLRIVQKGPFGDLSVVSRKGAEFSAEIRTNKEGPDRILLRRGRESLVLGDPDAARSHFNGAVSYMPDSLEGRFGLALCDLLQGDPEGAMARVRLARREGDRLLWRKGSGSGRMGLVSDRAPLPGTSGGCGAARRLVPAARPSASGRRARRSPRSTTKAWSA